jgi:uncharacterized protein (DUF1697 family)
MPELVAAFTDAGTSDVRTHGQSGNVLFSTDRPAARDSRRRSRGAREALRHPDPRDRPLARRARRDDRRRPADHGSAKLRSEVIFLKHPLTAEKAMAEMPELREGVDAIAPGPGALYFSRVAARATKTRIRCSWRSRSSSR